MVFIVLCLGGLCCGSLVGWLVVWVCVDLVGLGLILWLPVYDVYYRVVFVVFWCVVLLFVFVVWFECCCGLFVIVLCMVGGFADSLTWCCWMLDLVVVGLVVVCCLISFYVLCITIVEFVVWGALGWVVCFGLICLFVWVFGCVCCFFELGV